MAPGSRVYHLKVDSSGRIVLPADLRARHGIVEGDTVILVDDAEGLHLKTRGQVQAEAQAYFAALAPASAVLSEEILADRRPETERG
jgi:AbrB family looped-hinge helix DNA binding protein